MYYSLQVSLLPKRQQNTLRVTPAFLPFFLAFPLQEAYLTTIYGKLRGNKTAVSVPTPTNAEVCLQNRMQQKRPAHAKMPSGSVGRVLLWEAGEVSLEEVTECGLCFPWALWPWAVSWQAVQQQNWLVGFIPQLHSNFRQRIPSFSQISNTMPLCTVLYSCEKRRKMGKTKAGRWEQAVNRDPGVTAVRGQGKRWWRQSSSRSWTCELITSVTMHWFSQAVSWSQLGSSKVTFLVKVSSRYQEIPTLHQPCLLVGRRPKLIIPVSFLNYNTKDKGGWHLLLLTDLGLQSFSPTTCPPSLRVTKTPRFLMILPKCHLDLIMLSLGKLYLFPPAHTTSHRQLQTTEVWC